MLKTFANRIEKVKILNKSYYIVGIQKIVVIEWTSWGLWEILLSITHCLWGLLLLGEDGTSKARRKSHSNTILCLFFSRKGEWLLIWTRWNKPRVEGKTVAYDGRGAITRTQSLYFLSSGGEKHGVLGKGELASVLWSICLATSGVGNLARN